MLRHNAGPPDRKIIREFGYGLILFFAVLAALSYHRGHPQRAASLLAAGLLLSALTLSSRTLGTAIYKAWMAVASMIGACVSAGVMALLYYGLMTPLAVYFRLSGRDVLRLKKGSRESYWTPLKPTVDSTYYERLF